MIFLTRFRAALAAWDVILLAIALTVAAYHVWPGWLRQAREAGVLSERLVWQEKQRRADLDREREREAAQAKIDTAERNLIDTQAAGAIRINELETAIAEKRKPADANAAAGVADRSTCDPIPERVRNALNSIGR
ncbi:secretion protein HylD [Rhizobium cremeum]|uniref:secretion protein HylD n=1 Tax=Rhizobium cremeum TaxID=2813827 RepID=UPI0039E1F05E